MVILNHWYKLNNMPIYFIISAIKLVSNINVLKVDIEMTPNMAWEEVNVIEKTCNSLHLFCRLIFNESNFFAISSLL